LDRRRPLTPPRVGLVFKAHRWLYHSTLGSRVIKKKKRRVGPAPPPRPPACRTGSLSCAAVAPAVGEREFVIDNLLVRIHCIIVMIRWTGLAPWEFEFPFPGSLTYTFLELLETGLVNTVSLHERLSIRIWHNQDSLGLISALACVSRTGFRPDVSE